MKPKPVPTAHGRSKPKTSGRTIWIFCIVVLLAFSAGVVGELVARAYISDVAIPEIVTTRNKGKARADANPADWAAQLLQQQRDTIVTFLSGSTELGKGVVVSADGWIITPAKVTRGASAVTVVLPNGSTLPSSQIIIDEYSQVAYVKVKAQQLPVVTFMSDTAALGQAVVSFSYGSMTGERLTFGHIENTAFNDSPTRSTIEQNLVYLFDQASRPEYHGAPIFNTTGELVGLDALDHRIIPVRSINRALYTVFDRDAVTTPRWQFEYTPEAEVTRLISPNLPLVVGDVILTVDGQSVSRTEDISELLMDATSDDVECTVLRDGIEQVVHLP